MTPHEFHLYCEGVRDRDEDDYSKAAWLQANIMNAIGASVGAKRKTKQKDLFKRRDAPPDLLSVKEMNDYMRTLVGKDKR